MRIIIFDGTFETTAFIRRLLMGLIEAENDVYVLGFNEIIKNPVKGVTYVKLGSNQSKFDFFKTTIRWGLKSNAIIETVKNIVRKNKYTLQQNNLAAALNSIQPDVVHLQWVSNIKLFEPLLQEGRFNFVLSQRGFQTNVRPFVNQKNLHYLKEWLPMFTGFHSVSSAISKVGDQIYNHPHKIDDVVYTGLDFSRIIFSDELPKNDRLQILSVGRPHWVKGYEYAIRAMKLLKDEGLNFNYQIIGGIGNEELLYLIDDLGLNNYVTLLPKLQQLNVFKLLQASNLMLLPSLEEGIANVAVESMALGIPVISTDCGGMKELITHGKEGWIVPAYDSHAIANQIIEFTKLKDREVLDICIFARAKVEQQHNDQRMIEDMLQLYSKCLSSSESKQKTLTN